MPEQLTLDGGAVPHSKVVRDRSRHEKSALGKAWREVNRALKERADQKGKA